MKLRILFFLAMIGLLSSCDPRKDPCASVDAPLAGTTFMLVDSSTGESLIGSNRVYDPDSLNFLNGFFPFRISKEQDTIVSFQFGTVSNGEILEFNLDENEIDTIQIEYDIRKTECFDIKDLKRFFYNGELIEPNDRQLHVIKK
mgnify:CR=1 FL=1